ncbi:unnamed protein product [Onchocerca ochengi]|uniref:Uncharacterized protein n=1 Tax=Onchocerca ochengi TaxID=42157 RepID=A0A182EK17_ONCOC|nr:unnamed protein product [Onchocerca ochengi]
MRCIHLTKDNEANEKYERKIGNTENQNIDSVNSRKYLDSLVQNTIKNISIITDMIKEHQTQQHLVDLHDKYASVIAKKNCSNSDSWDKNGQGQKLFNRTTTTTWLRQMIKKCTEQMFGNIEISINVVRRTDDFYIWAIIPQKGKNS